MEKSLFLEASDLLNKVYLSEQTVKRFRIVAMLLDGSKIVSFAYNAGIRHAEMNCFEHTNFGKLPKYKKFDLMVVRVNSLGEPANAKPCKHCTMYLKKNNKIRNVLYTDSNGFLVSQPVCAIQSDFLSRGNRVRLNYAPKKECIENCVC